MTAHQKEPQADPGLDVFLQPIVDQLSAALAGRRPAVQGAALAECLALWLAGHGVDGDAAATARMRRRLFRNHCAYVKKLIPIYAKQLGTGGGM